VNRISLSTGKIVAIDPDQCITCEGCISSMMLVSYISRNKELTLFRIDPIVVIELHRDFGGKCFAFRGSKTMFVA
jgi:hypothetical protein